MGNVGNGKRIRFWQDDWLDECPLKIKFPRLFKINIKQEWSVAELNDVEWNFDFRRILGIEEVIEWEELSKDLENSGIERW
jgi:hypothetical protein